MPPNTIDIPPYEPQIIPLPVVQPKPSVNENYIWHIFQSVLNMIGRLSIGIVVGICLLFAFRSGVPLSATNQHIVLCVIGYQLLMAEACLALAPGSWTSNFTLVDKRRVHWILLLAGSILAIVGSILKSIDNSINWFSLHGKFGLVAMGFTVLSLINGLTSLYAYELRRFIPVNLSKLTHICFGVVAFLCACISLIYGMQFPFFVNWMPIFNDTLIGFTIALTVLVIVNPFITFFKKSKNALNR